MGWVLLRSARSHDAYPGISGVDEDVCVYEKHDTHAHLSTNLLCDTMPTSVQHPPQWGSTIPVPVQAHPTHIATRCAPTAAVAVYHACSHMTHQPHQ